MNSGRNFKLYLISIFVTIHSCGGTGLPHKWPPEKALDIKKLYPYDFNSRGVDKLRAFKNILLSRQFNKKEEDVYLFAFGKAVADALLYAHFLGGNKRKQFLQKIGNLLEIPYMESMAEVKKNAALFYQPLDLIAKKHPSSPYRTSASEFRWLLEILTTDSPTPPSLLPAMKPKGVKLTLEYELKTAYAIRIFEWLGEAAPKPPPSRTSFIIRKLLPYSVNNPFTLQNPQLTSDQTDIEQFIDTVMVVNTKQQANSHRHMPTRAIELILKWVNKTLKDVGEGNDPLCIEIKDMVKKKFQHFHDMLISAPALLTIALPYSKFSNSYESDFYPYGFIIAKQDGSLNIGVEPIFKIDSSTPINRNSEFFLGEGKKVKIHQLRREITRAVAMVRTIVPDNQFMNLINFRVVAIAAEGELPVEKILPIIKAVKQRYDTVLITMKGKDGIFNVPAKIEPNCNPEGIKITISFEEDGIKILHSTDESFATKYFPIGVIRKFNLAETITDYITGAIDTHSPYITIEITYRAGQWKWKHIAGLHSYLLKTIKEINPTSTFYLLPEVTMDEQLKLQKKFSFSTQNQPPAELVSVSPEKTSPERFIIEATIAGQKNRRIIDEKLTEFVTMLPQTESAFLILNMARCLGGDYKQRSIKALSKANSSVLTFLSSYIGRKDIAEIIDGIFEKAGKKSSQPLIRRLNSPVTQIWSSAYRILTKMRYDEVEEKLEEILKSNETELKIRGLKLLSQIGPAGGIPILKNLIDDPDPLVKRWAIVCAGMLGMNSVAPSLIEIIEKYENGDAEEKKATSSIVADCIFALGLLEVPEAEKIVKRYGRSPDPRLRATAALSIGNIGLNDEQSYIILTELLNDKTADVKINAIKSIGVLKDTLYLDALYPLIHDSAPDVKNAALETINLLEELKNKKQEQIPDINEIEKWCLKATPDQILNLANYEEKKVLRCLAKLSRSKNKETRKAACIAIGKRGKPDGKFILMKRLKDKNIEVRKAAAEALKKIKAK